MTSEFKGYATKVACALDAPFIRHRAIVFAGGKPLPYEDCINFFPNPYGDMRPRSLASPALSLYKCKRKIPHQSPDGDSFPHLT